MIVIIKYKNNATMYHLGIRMKGVGSPKLPRKGKC
jgi:hypothetical protein